MYDSLILPWSPHPSRSETLYRAAGLVRTKGTIFLQPPPTSTLRAAFNAPPRPKTRMSAGAVALCKHFERRNAPSSQMGGCGVPSPAFEPASVSCSSSSSAAEKVVVSSTGGGDEQQQQQQRQDDVTDEEVPSPSPTPASARAATNRPEGAAQSYKLLKRKEGDAPHPYWDVPRGSNAEKTQTAERVLDRVLTAAVWRNVMLLHEGVAVYEVRVKEGWGMRWGLDVEREDGAGGDEGDGGEKGLGDGGDGAEGEMAESTDEVGEGSSGWRIVNVTFRGLLEPIAGLDHELDRDV